MYLTNESLSFTGVPGCSEVASDPTLLPTSSPYLQFKLYTGSPLQICVQFITIRKYCSKYWNPQILQIWPIFPASREQPYQQYLTRNGKDPTYCNISTDQPNLLELPWPMSICSISCHALLHTGWFFSLVTPLKVLKSLSRPGLIYINVDSPNSLRFSKL